MASNLRFLYGTDFHGKVPKYETLLSFALDQKIPLIHLGADVLPKGSDILKEQKKFVNGYLREFYDRCHNQGIDVLMSFGNDDIYTRKPHFRKYAALLDETPFERNGYSFRAYNFCQDYPFGLKTACKWDHAGWKCPEEYQGRPVDCSDQGFVTIENTHEYFSKKGTIEDDLKAIHPGPQTIMAIHQPPWGLGLDVCLGNRRVGSKAVYEWIEREQANLPLVLCGHIHESPQVSGVWKSKIGSTVVVQPGQLEFNKTTMVYCEFSESEVIANLVEK